MALQGLKEWFLVKMYENDSNNSRIDKIYRKTYTFAALSIYVSEFTKVFLLMIKNAKRTKIEKTLLHSWHPYYAGYSESFVSSVLKYEKNYLNSSSVILDPWMGSGTTGLVCQSYSQSCIGLDINIVMATFAAAKSSMNIDILNKKGVDLLEQIIKKAAASRKNYNIDHLSELMDEKYANKLKRILHAIDVTLEQSNGSHLCPLNSFFIAIVLVSNRELMGYKNGSNPTWFTKSEPIKHVTLKSLKTCLYNNYHRMLSDLNNTYRNTRQDLSIFHADSNSMPIESKSIDLIITSPPYLTRIDYAVSTKAELLLLTSLEEFKQTRTNTIGTTTIFSHKKIGCLEWGDICNDVLARIFNHDSRASNNYYVKNKVQYFESAYKSLSEMLRVLKKDAPAYLVIQNSYYKDIEIDLPAIYKQMAINLGFTDAKTVRKDILRTSMASINTKSKKYVQNKIYYEEIIRIVK